MYCTIFRISSSLQLTSALCRSDYGWKVESRGLQRWYGYTLSVFTTRLAPRRLWRRKRPMTSPPLDSSIVLGELGSCLQKTTPTHVNLFLLATVYSVREFMAFTSEVLAQRTSTGERRTVKEQGALDYQNTFKSLNLSCFLRVQMSCVCALRQSGVCGDSRWGLPPQSGIHTHEQGGYIVICTNYKHDSGSVCMAERRMYCSCTELSTTSHVVGREHIC